MKEYDDVKRKRHRISEDNGVAYCNITFFFSFLSSGSLGGGGGRRRRRRRRRRRYCCDGVLGSFDQESPLQHRQGVISGHQVSLEHQSLPSQDQDCTLHLPMFVWYVATTLPIQLLYVTILIIPFHNKRWMIW